MGGEPSSEPTMLVTWCCMQCGNVEPSPTMNDDPQPFAPRMFESQFISSFAYVPTPTSVSYSAAMTDRPAPCEVVSQVSQGKPNPNGSAPARATAPSSSFLRSPSNALGVVSSPGTLPACASAR